MFFRFVAKHRSCTLLKSNDMLLGIIVILGMKIPSLAAQPVISVSYNISCLITSLISFHKYRYISKKNSVPLFSSRICESIVSTLQDCLLYSFHAIITTSLQSEAFIIIWRSLPGYLTSSIRAWKFLNDLSF